MKLLIQKPNRIRGRRAYDGNRLEALFAGHVSAIWPHRTPDCPALSSIPWLTILDMLKREPRGMVSLIARDRHKPPRHPSRRAAWNRQKPRCPACRGCMRISVGPGRMIRYRGEDGYEIPAELAFPVCLRCGAEWLTDEQIVRLGQALERQTEGRLGP